MIDLNGLPQNVKDEIELREGMDQTFYRFTETDYSDWFWTWLQERADPNNPQSVLLSIYGKQGCHLKGTLIQTYVGLKPIESVVAGDLVWAGNAWRPCIPIIKGRQQTLRVRLKSGTLLNMTPDHVMKTGRGWMKAEDVVVGDVMVQGNIPWSTEWNEESERAAVVAMLLADGHADVVRKVEKYDYVRKTDRNFVKEPKKFHEYDAHRVRFYKSDGSLRNFMKKMLVKHFGANVAGEYRDKGTVATRVVCVVNRRVFERVVAEGVPIGKKSSIVEIPQWVQRSDAAMNGFLAGYFACDGSFYQGGVEISSCSESLIDQMQAWLSARGVVAKKLVKVRKNERWSTSYRLVVRQWDSLKEWVDHVPNLSTKKQAVLRAPERVVRKNGTKAHQCTVESISKGCVGDVFDLHVKDVHEYIANGVVSSNSGKSMAAISICSFIDPNFMVRHIYFGYDKLVYDRGALKDNTAVLVDEQSQTFGLDAHRINIILTNLKEQLRKKSIHMIFCAPVLYPEAQSSMYQLEVMFIDYENQECYAALKTRDGLTLGHVRIPYPLKVLEDGSTLTTREFIAEYEKKKDDHLEMVLGNRNVDMFEERAEQIMKHPLFKQAEKVYKRKMGYIPQNTLVQLINKIYPEYHAGVVPLEIAGRIKLNKEVSGQWEVAGKAVRRKDRGK
jgi:intein/homing endonuclease/ABC-type dipeptide/oligopeptide/nickel transport system ATPase component